MTALGGKGVRPDILSRLGAPTPLIPIRIMAECQNKDPKLATVRVCPDTGATCDVLREDVAKKVGAIIEPNMMGYRLIDAQKQPIHIIGTTQLKIQRWGSL